jgi:PAS domain S-box-containing protein
MRPLRVLIVEDSEDDAELLLFELRRGGFEVDYRRVQTAAAMREALRPNAWDVVVSDFSMPDFTAVDALEVLRASGLDLPFILVSGTIGEETAVQGLKAGANDFLTKGRLARLIPAIERELREAQVRRDRRRAREALRESELKYRRIVETAQEGIWVFDASYRTTYVNARMAKMLGTTAEAIAGAAFDQFLDEESKTVEIFKPPANSLGEHHVLKLKRRTGGEFWASVSSNLMTDDTGRQLGALAMITDITEQRQLQAQLMTSDRMVSMGMLAAGVVHEIHNPLAAVLANLDLAIGDLSGLGTTGPSHDEVSTALGGLRDARDAGERLRQIVHDVRIFSRAEDDATVQVDIERVLDSTIRMAWNEIRHRARLVKDYQSLPPVQANESRLGQVFLNLIVNAAQAIPEGAAEQNEIRLTTRTDAAGHAVVEIRDTGGGMDAQTLDRLFAPFFTTKPPGLGTGLGLSICQRLVGALGGTIDASSTLGTGSTFRVRLPPAAAAPADAAATVSSAASPPAAPVSVAVHGRVLIIDDEPMILNVARRTLAQDQHDVTTANSGKEALARIAAGERFDVIICDLMMPEMTGMDVYAELNRVTPDQAERMVFLSGGAFTPRARAFLEEERVSRMEKPFHPGALRALVNERIRLADDLRRAAGR